MVMSQICGIGEEGCKEGEAPGQSEIPNSSHRLGPLGNNHPDHPSTKQEAELYSNVTPGSLLHQAGPTSAAGNLNSLTLQSSRRPAEQLSST